MREILTRLVERARGTVEVKVFGDKVILDEGEPRSHSYERFFLTLGVQMLKTGQDATFSSLSFLQTFP